VTVTTDAHGNPMTGGSADIDLYDSALDRLVRFHPDIVELAGELTADDDGVAMAWALNAYLCLMSTDVDDVSAARAAMASMADSEMNEREQAHADAINAWVHGGWNEAATRLDDLLRGGPPTCWPDDRPPARLLPGRRPEPARSSDPLAAQFDPDHPHAPFVPGCVIRPGGSGHYEQALDAGWPPSRPTLTTCGNPRRGAHLRDARPRRRRHSSSSGATQ
jgi:hypothetical protein